ncbi:MAG: PQQ-binding-like beta-propeller repeat protein [bacterium]
MNNQKSKISRALRLALCLLFPVYCLLSTTYCFSSDWQMFLGDARHSGYTSTPVQPPLTEKWQYTGSAAVFSSPTKAGYLVYFGSANGTLYAVHVLSGNLMYQFSGQGRVVSAPAVSDGTLVFTTHNGNIYALEATSGSLRWSIDAGGTIFSSPTISGDKVFISVGDPVNKVLALKLSSGAILWEFAASQPFYSTPAVSDGIVWVGCNDGKFYGLNAASGSKFAEFSTGGLIYASSPAISGSTVFGAGGEYDKKVYAFNEQTGALVWESEPFPGDTLVKISSVIASGDRVYLSIGYPDQKIAALNAANGQLIWYASIGDITDGNYAPSPAVAAGLLYVASRDGILHIFNAADGGNHTTVDLGAPTVSSPALADGMVFIAAQNGTLKAFLGTDNAEPTVSLNALNPYVSGTLEITGTAVDDSLQSFTLEYGAGASPAAWTNISSSNSAVENGTIGVWYTPAVSDGQYTLRLTVADNSGNTAQTTQTVTVDNTPPTFAGLSSAATGSDGGSINLSWGAAIDNYSPVTYYIFQSTIPGGYDFSSPSYTTGLTQHQVGGLIGGTKYYFVVKAVDQAENMDGNMVEGFATAAVETVPPVFDGVQSVTAAADGRVTIKYNAATDDSTPVSYRIYQAETSGGQNFASPTYVTNLTTYTTPALENGRTYYFVVRAVDSVGNEDANKIEESAVIPEVITPVIQITSPSDQAVLTTPSVIISGLVSAGATFTINGDEVPVNPDGTFQGTILLQEGENIITLEATAASGGTTVKTITVTVDALLPAAMISEPSDGATVNGIMTIRGTASDENFKKYKLEYGATTAPDKWTKISESDAGVINGALGEWDTSRFGGVYSLRLTVEDAAGNLTSGTVILTVSNKVTVSGTLAVDQWQFLSLPVTPDNPSPKAIFGDAGYKIIRWDPKAAPDPNALNYVSPSELGAGEGFAIKAYGADLAYSYTGVIPDTTSDFAMSLNPGWNQIGAPYNRDFSIGTIKVRTATGTYDFEEAVSEGLISSAVYAYEGGGYRQYNSSYNVEKQGGYFIKAYADVELLFDSAQPEPIAGQRVAAKIVRPRLKLLRLSAGDGELSDIDNFLGISPDAQDAFDPKDAEEPPRSADRFLSVYFSSSALEASRLANDVRAPVTGSVDWLFNVETSEKGRTVTLTWDATELADGKYDITLTDRQTGATVDMLEQKKYNFVSSSDSAAHSFRITVTLKGADEISVVRHALKKGWNLMSFPVEPEVTDAVKQLGDDLSKLDVYQFHDGEYYTVLHKEGVDIQAGIGYWVYVDADISVDVEGVSTDPAQAVGVNLTAGWNLIGDPYSEPLAWGDNIAVRYLGETLTLGEAAARGWLDGRLFEFNGEAYISVETGGEMIPWEGYFVKSHSACELILKQ